jgi:hypothetical protein
MNRSRANRYRLCWLRYDVRTAKAAGGMLHHAPAQGSARASDPFYRNGALFPYGWQPVMPRCSCAEGHCVFGW